MLKKLTMVGAPSSAGAYAPGQERAPSALRAAGLPELLMAAGFTVDDRGDVAGFRWRVDHANQRAMNAGAVAGVARAVAEQVALALAHDNCVMVLGGDCTVELGTVAGATADAANVGLIYIDLDTDLNTPESTDDGALDWMGVAHLLGLAGTVPELVALGARRPLLHADQVLYFGTDNVEPCERKVINELRISEMPLAEVAADPTRAAQRVLAEWGERFDRLLVHVDLDVLDFLDMPLAENTRRNVGLKFSQLMMSLKVFLRAPNCVAITLCELNPDHGEADGSTLRQLAEALTQALGEPCNDPRERR
jgi:arginase